MVTSWTLTHVLQNYGGLSCYRLKKILQQNSSNGLNFVKLEENLRLKTYHSPGHRLFLLLLVPTKLSKTKMTAVSPCF